MGVAITREEARKTIFSMNPNKASGPDEFSTEFFHKAWSVVGEDVTKTVLEFFLSGQLLKETNATIITLVPRRKNPSSMGDDRPISCCNFNQQIEVRP